jgi:hypothetical protein
VKYIYWVLITFCSIASAEPKILQNCRDADFPDRTQVIVETDAGKIIAKVTAKVESGATIHESYLVADKSNSKLFRYIDPETSGSRFLLQGDKNGVPPLLIFQAVTSESQVIRANLFCRSVDEE